MLYRSLRIGSLLGLMALTAVAQAAQAAAPFDLGEPSRIDAGKRRFGSTCAAYCHGSEGAGGRAPAFKGNTQLTPEDAFRTIVEGRRGIDIMPPWGSTFSPEQIWELVAYIQHLSRQPAP